MIRSTVYHAIEDKEIMFLFLIRGCWTSSCLGLIFILFQGLRKRAIIINFLPFVVFFINKRIKLFPNFSYEIPRVSTQRGSQSNLIKVRSLIKIIETIINGFLSIVFWGIKFPLVQQLKDDPLKRVNRINSVMSIELSFMSNNFGVNFVKRSTYLPALRERRA